ncbi:MAG: Na/Pi cotransporter family protein [bacterium]
MTLDIWQLVAGLGLFLFGMQRLEQGLQALGGSRLKAVIANYTSTPIRGVLFGTFATAVLQSSSMVGLVTLAFVGAGILRLSNALGIIIGANLGTTFTGWLVTALGFKLNLTDYALPLIGLGALGVVLLQSKPSWFHRCQILLGFGLLLFGLDFMKSAMDFVKDLVDPSIFQDYNVLVYVLGGVIFTALIQSSSATMMIVLSAISADLLPLSTAAAIAIGADLGTTGTVLIGGIGGTPDRKRVALSHLTFNLVTDIVALILLVPLLYLITNIFGISDPMFALVAFHSSFNLIGIFLFLPFIKPFTEFLNNRFIEEHGGGVYYARAVEPGVPEASRAAIEKDVERLIVKAMVLNLRAMKLQDDALFEGFRAKPVYEQVRGFHWSFDEQYADLKYTEHELIELTYDSLKGTTPEYQRALNGLLSSARNAVYSSKALKDIRGNLAELRMQHVGSDVLNEITQSSKSIYRHLLTLLESSDPISQESRKATLSSEIDRSHRRIHELVIEHIRKPGGDVEDADSSLLNLNRELQASRLALLAAVSDFVGGRLSDGEYSAQVV